MELMEQDKKTSYNILTSAEMFNATRGAARLWGGGGCTCRELCPSSAQQRVLPRAREMKQVLCELCGSKQAKGSRGLGSSAPCSR